MTAEIKPGKWRLKDGREVVVFSDTTSHGWLTWMIEENCVTVREEPRFEGAECLGPAVIGEVTADDPAYPLMMARHYEQQCKDLEAETVKARELLEQSEERCEELNSMLNKSELERYRHKFGKDGTMPYWQSGVSCEVEGDLVIHRYKTLTVMVRGEREACCYYFSGRYDSSKKAWYAVCGDMTTDDSYVREDAEAWCREQLEPRWREATEGDVGKACRVRDSEGEPWDHDRTLVGRHEDIVGGPWATVSSSGSLSGWRYCEVQD